MQDTSKIADLFESIQKERPLVHCITNMVTVNDCANILLAIGASPTMASHPLEVEEITAGCNSLVCNFGAIKDYDAMLLAGKKATAKKHPIIVDPVGIGGSSYRRNMLYEFLQATKASCIRGNASEIQALMMNQKTVTGVDAAKNGLYESDRKQFIQMLMESARKLGTILIVSGEKDLITDGGSCYEVSNGHPLMARITGSGCMSSALLGAFFGTSEKEEEDLILRAVACCAVMGICGEVAAKECEKVHGGTMTFRLHLIDAVSLLTSETILDYARVRRLV